MATESSAQRVVEDLRVEFIRRRISQEKLAQTLVGMSQSKISRRLKGEISPTLAELEALAAAADLSVEITLHPAALPPVAGEAS